ncbi:MAG: ABC transporter ATP-binding protein [Oscillospiraceae bacterium]|nr:ABC transporter ATP-binding protein [Oscillospiraceae bacterium]
MPKGAPEKFHGKRPGLDMATVKRLLGYFRDYKWQMLFVFVCIILSTVASVASSLFIESLIDDYILPLIDTENPNFGPLLGAIAGMAALYICGILSSLFYNRTMAKVTHGILDDIRGTMFRHMQKLPIKYFDTHSHGDVMSYYTNDADTLRQMLSQSVPQVVQSVLSLVTVFFAMLSQSVWLTLIVLIFTFFMMKLLGAITGKSGHYFMNAQRSIGNMNGYIEEMINGQKVVKVFNHEEKAKEAFDERNGDLCENATNANKLASTLMPLMNGLGYFLYVLIAIVGGYLALSGFPNLSLKGIVPLTLGTIASFLQLSRSFCQPIGQVSNQLNAVIMAVAGAKRIFELIDEPAEENNGKVTLVNMTRKNGVIEETEERTEQWAWKIPAGDGTFEYRELKGEVHLENVDFSYEEGKRVLHDVTFYAEPGQKVALVGATGAGKTTITNLINHFYDIESGVITYDGIDIRDINKNDLRRSMGVVLQDVNLFTGTVMENLRYGRPDATDEECIAAAKLADADSFIRMLPDGYNTILEGDGSGLSQGQRQLISIARAAVADPPVMILDEATSSIDTRTEAIVQRGMDALMYGRTVFVIAHRLSTVQNSDVIMVLDHGRIIERGSHDKLIEQKGTYYRLYTGAFELD